MYYFEENNLDEEIVQNLLFVQPTQWMTTHLQLI